MHKLARIMPAFPPLVAIVMFMHRMIIDPATSLRRWITGKAFEPRNPDSMGFQCDMCMGPRGHSSLIWGSCQRCNIDVCYQCIGKTREIPAPPSDCTPAQGRVYSYVYANRKILRTPLVEDMELPDGSMAKVVRIDTYNKDAIIVIVPRSPEADLDDNDYYYMSDWAYKQLQDARSEVDVSTLDSALDSFVLGSTAEEDWEYYMEQALQDQEDAWEDRLYEYSLMAVFYIHEPFEDFEALQAVEFDDA